MSTFYLLHGFNVKDGGLATTGSLRNKLEDAGHTVREIKYGWMGRVKVRLCNKSLARAIADMAEPDSYLIAHSNGAAIAYWACEFGAPFKQVFLINPALDAEMEMPNVSKVRVFHALSDPWTKLARWIPFSVWGRQGAVGYTGLDLDDRYHQTELDALTGEKVGHSGIFKTSALRSKLINIILGDTDEQ